MSQILRKSTQVKVRIGPAVAVGDGFTPVTGLTLSGADEAELLKADGAATVSISGATFAAITGADGWYDLTLTTSHTDTAGTLDVVINDDSLILPIFARFQVVEQAVYDALYATGAEGVPASFAAAFANLFASSEGIVVSTCASGSTASVIQTNLTEATDNHYKRRTLVFTGGALKGQAAAIPDGGYNGTTKAITLATALTEAPADTDPFVII
jgi:hypothetical protein